MATVVEAFEYGQKAGRQMAFLQRAGAVDDAALRVVVVIGGLTDGPFSLAYSPLLATSLASIGFSLVHFVLRSSYIGYGIHTYDILPATQISLGSFTHSRDITVSSTMQKIWQHYSIA